MAVAQNVATLDANAFAFLPSFENITQLINAIGSVNQLGTDDTQIIARWDAYKIEGWRGDFFVSALHLPN